MTATALTTPPAPRGERFPVTRAALRQLALQRRVWVGGGILLVILLLAVFATLGGAS